MRLPVSKSGTAGRELEQVRKCHVSIDASGEMQSQPEVPQGADMGGRDPGPTLPRLLPLSGVSHRLDLTVAPALLLAFTGSPVTHSTRSEVLGPLWALPRLTPA